MPTTRRKRGQVIREALEPSMRVIFLSGSLAEASAAADGAGRGFDGKKQWLLQVLEHSRLWRQNEDELVAEWSEQHPGCRPAGWWEFSAIEARHWVDAEGIARPPDIGPDWCLWRDSWGIVLDDRAGRRVVAVESEPSYLARLGLFLPGERRRLPRNAFAPVVVAEAYDLRDEDDREDEDAL
jgi:hypothetical protein